MIKKKPTFKVGSVYSLLAIVVLSGCGYQAKGVSPSDRAMHVTVPLIRDDDDGILRNALAESLSETGKYRYTSSTSAPYELVVKIEKSYTDTVGYFHEAKGGKLSRTIPSEGKKVLVASATLRDSRTKEAILEPFQVSTQGYYDYQNPTSTKDIEFADRSGKKARVLQYSLGQLDSEEGAKAEIQDPLLRDIARKIGEGLSRAPKAEKKK